MRNDGCKCIFCRYKAVTERIKRFSSRDATPYNQRVLSKARAQFNDLVCEVKQHSPWITLQMPESSRDVTDEEVDEVLRACAWMR